MSHFAATTTSNPNAPRKIEEFRNMREFLRAIHDAVESHRRQYFATGLIHGNINTETIYIGSPSSMSNRRGFLIESPIVQHQFQSVNVLSRTVLFRNTTVPVDYLDDLESFYYIIAWVSMVYTAPGTRLQVHQYPNTLANWAATPARDSALEKESMLQGPGFGGDLPLSTLDQPGVLPDAVFEALLVEFHSILRENYFKKWANNTEDCTNDVYGKIMQLLRWSVDALPSWA